MFDIGWSEMALIAFIALIVIGPKELPKAMRSAAKWARKARSLAREFQSGIDDMVREADLEDARNALDATRDFDIGKAIEDTVDPTGNVREEAQDLQKTAHGASGESDWSESIEAPAGDAHDGGTADKKIAAAGDPEAPGDGEGGNEKATVVKHPLNIAPPDSVTPPPEEEPAVAAEETSDNDGSQRRA